MKCRIRCNRGGCDINIDKTTKVSDVVASHRKFFGVIRNLALNGKPLGVDDYNKTFAELGISHNREYWLTNIYKV